MSTPPPLPFPREQPSMHAVRSSSPFESSGYEQSALPPLVDESAASGLGGDMEKHPKGRRKRTAAKDKMILEEAYRSNPKPDKHARQQVVDRVSLNEKEVQIWFQNRRQNDRRKSRPLSPEELAALRFGGMQHVSSDSVSVSASLGRRESIPSSSDLAVANGASSSPTHAARLPQAPRPELSRSLSDAAIASSSVAKMPTSLTPPPSSSQDTPGETGSITHSFSSNVGYLANRWNLTPSSNSTPPSTTRSATESRLPPLPSSEPPAKSRSAKSQSQVRLSLSLEGKAELVSNLSSPTRPSPTKAEAPMVNPLPPPRLRAGLSRSHSAALPVTSIGSSSVTLPPISTLTRGLPPSLSRGRSRDVQAWESCADSETRDELTAQAENESNGSAIAAISLLRSTSSSSSLASVATNSALQPSSAKRNASVTRAPLRQAKKAKLSRTNSTFGRLEQVDGNIAKPRAHLNGKVKVSMLVTPNPDSDKENWSPDEDEQPRRRPLPSFKAPVSGSPRRRTGGRILQEHGNRIPALLNRASTAPSGDITIFEDGDTKAAANKFSQVSPSKRGDMDCVAGLLSLSQGAWR